MKRVLVWLLVGIGITVASVAVFIFAAWLFPGDPGRFYSLFAAITAGLGLLVRMLMRPPA